ncbi:MAG: hypothetical protein ABIU95_04290 [Burkholderiales bacterium]
MEARTDGVRDATATTKKKPTIVSSAVNTQVWLEEKQEQQLQVLW